MASVELYDTTLRDGAQMEGLSFSVEDKLKIVRKLDELGVHYIEGGWPGSNPKDVEFFAQAKGLRLGHARLVAFGSTRRSNSRAEADPNLQALVDAGTEVVTIVAKASRPQVTQVLGTTLEENLAMISDSIRFLKGKGLRVFLDAEHFFDGFKADAAYALGCLRVAAEAGADTLVLCDSNGGSLPDQIVTGVRASRDVSSVPVGIHTHNDADLAVANSLAAVEAGAIQVQGTINGYGERCGNANLCSIVPNLQLKLGIPCLAPEQLARLTEVAHFVSELANLAPNPHLPYVGSSAFAHKGGLHVSAVSKWEDSYQHAPPEAVGNRKRVVVSELSGRSNVLYKARELGLKLDEAGPGVSRVLESIKLMENQGFQYDGAEASFELLVRRAQLDYKPPFELVDFLVLVEKGRRPTTAGEDTLSDAHVKVRVKEQVVHTAAEGNGPVNALDQALRKALLPHYPALAQVKLVDYKVRILDETAGTAAGVRVLIESSDGQRQWRTVGSSPNIIEASWLALADSLEYWLLRRA
ncbi:MAG: citramalate synthase [Chloroflexi bacterium]|nr:citramalate synthase [Chloroflexota bacterium]